MMSRKRSRKHLDHTLALLADPYRFIGRQADEAGADILETRLLLRSTTCVRGSEAAELFYNPDSFKRAGAMPAPVRKTLLGEGGVQGLDGEAHRHRKALFMSLMAPDRVRELGRIFSEDWLRMTASWRGRDEIILYDELHPIFTEAVCAWAAVPLPPEDLRRRTSELRALFDAAGARGPRHLWSRWARWRVDHWLTDIVEAVREGRHAPPAGTPAYMISWWRDHVGDLLPAKIAAVELANILRPTVATSVYIVFVAHALHAEPHASERAAADPEYRRAFVQEVRRFYPFFPAVAARASRNFTWCHWRFPKNRRVLLDLYGTNHHGLTWGDPEQFRPARFLEGDPGPYAFIPQGGGGHLTGHRCPGEWIVIELMERAVCLLSAMRYEVPEQDLEIDFHRLPALPKSGFRIIKEGA
ncbi:cytochrome P450 [Sphingomonas sp. A2-49]|uniref:cytochrome P450 n=1 Tax=Sphingomonas sp. A2-49 TaxID=1391375 RepID=UPI0021D11621|nr:cytochrome P450 [Sphingomonas sp. A2-49]MCU6453395.1 cytochrome P450 [Sphingomonas sp. A2-49]